VGLVDSIKDFEENSPHGLLGYNLLIDAHHPNLKGYILLARGFAKRIEEMYGQKIVRDNLTEEEILSHFDFTKDELFKVYISRCKWLIAFGSMDVDKEENLNMAEHFLMKAKEIDKNNKEIALLYFVLSLLRDDREEALYWLEKGKLSTEQGNLFQGNEWILEKPNLADSALLQDILAQDHLQR